MLINDDIILHRVAEQFLPHIHYTSFLISVPHPNFHNQPSGLPYPSIIHMFPLLWCLNQLQNSSQESTFLVVW